MKINNIDNHLKVLSPPNYDPKIKEYEKFQFHIFAVYNTADIRGIILNDECLEKMKKLSKEMKIFNNTNDLEAIVIEIGEFYSVFDDEWHRVQCLDCNLEKKTATLFFIDRGDQDTFPTYKLQLLPEKFRLLPMQSIKLSLSNLEVFHDCINIYNFMSSLLLGKNVHVKVMSCLMQEKNIPILSVLINTTNDFLNEIDGTVNNLIQEEILESSILDPQHALNIEEKFQACVTHVSEKGIFIQIKSKGLTYLNKLMHSLTQEFLDNKYYKLRPTIVIDPEKIYLAKNLDDHNWYRVKIIEVKKFNEAIVELIDFGIHLNVKKDNLVLIEYFSKFITEYPKQAIKITLHQIPPIDFDKYMIDRFCQVIYNPGLLYVQKVGNFKNQPVVQLYKQTENKCLVSVNNYLFEELIKFSLNLDVEELPLPKPFIPENGSEFDVSISVVNHPEDFTVQPLDKIIEFRNLMQRLLDVCEEFSGPHLTPDCIKVGSVYAVLDDSNDTWYRGFITKIITETLYVVYACDYGDYKCVKIDDLQPLHEEFLDFPYLGIKSRLVDVTPEIIKNWTSYDSLKFNELVLSKNFVSFVVSKEIVILQGFKQIVLNLKLIDTETDEDVYISDIVNNFHSV